MYEEFYGFRETPFSPDPDPHYVYPSEAYRGALGPILRALDGASGVLVVTGEVGTGKTTLCLGLLEALDPTRYRPATIFNPFLDVSEMLEALLTELGCTYPEGASTAELREHLRRFLLARQAEGLVCVAVLDDAHHLTPELLDQVGALAELEADNGPLLRIVLAGPPELLERGKGPASPRLDERAAEHCTLANLRREELPHYVHHRLNVAGGEGRVEFSDEALLRIFQATGGVPRLVNLACDRALLAAYAANASRISGRHVEHGLASLRGLDAWDAAGESRDALR